MSENKRVLVTGSRDWTDEDLLWSVLCEDYLPHRGSLMHTVVLVHGACPEGLDDLASLLWTANGGLEEPHPADWYPDPDHKYDPTAGHKRNQLMVDLGADVCLGFFMPCRKPSCPKVGVHASHGTTDCVKRAEKAGIPVRRFGFEGV